MLAVKFGGEKYYWADPTAAICVACVMMFTAVRLGRRAAERFWEGLRSGAAIVETVGAADLDTAWEIGKSYRDQDFSIVDRTSFAVMRRLGIERAASGDDDFAIFRFGPNRRRAFTVVR